MSWWPKQSHTDISIDFDLLSSDYSFKSLTLLVNLEIWPIHLTFPTLKLKNMWEVDLWDVSAGVPCSVVFTPVGFLQMGFKSSLPEEVRFNAGLHSCMCFPMQRTSIIYLWWVQLDPTIRDPFGCRTVGSPLVML